MEIKSEERGITGVPLFQVVLSWNHFTQGMHSYISNFEMIWKGFWRSEWAPCGAAELGAARGGTPGPRGSARRGDTGTSLPATAQGWMPSSVWHKVPWRRDHNAIRLSNRASPLKKTKSISNPSLSSWRPGHSKEKQRLGIWNRSVRVLILQKKAPASPRLNKVRDALEDCKIALITGG